METRRSLLKIHSRIERHVHGHIEVVRGGRCHIRGHPKIDTKIAENRRSNRIHGHVVGGQIRIDRWRSEDGRVVALVESWVAHSRPR